MAADARAGGGRLAGAGCLVTAATRTEVPLYCVVEWGGDIEKDFGRELGIGITRHLCGACCPCARRSGYPLLET